MKRYLTNRKQFVEIHGVKPDILTVTTAFLQGSILGPLLCYCSQYYKSEQFADIHCLYLRHYPFTTTME